MSPTFSPPHAPTSSSDAARNRLLATIAATSDFVGIARPDGGIEFMNRAGRRLVGLGDYQDLAGIKATQFYTPETLALISRDGFPTALREGSWSGDGDIVTLSGEMVPVSIVMVGHSTGDRHDPPFFSAVMRDLRERKRSAEALLEFAEALARSEERLRSAIDGGLDAFMALTSVRDENGEITDFDIVEASPRAAELVKLSRDDLLGRRICDLFGIDRYSDVFARWVDVTRTNLTMEWEFETRDPRIKATWLHAQAVPLDRGIALTLRDISSRKQAEAALRLTLDVTQEVANAADASAALEIVLRRMCNAASWDLGEAWIVTGGTHLMRGPVCCTPGDAELARFQAETASIELTSGLDLPGAAWATGSTKILSSLSGTVVASSRRNAALEARLTAGVSVPVIASGKVVAVLSFLVRDSDRVDDARVELLNGMATQVGAIIGHKLVERALTRERAFLGAVLDSLSESVTVCDPDGKLTLVNRAMRRVHGIAVDAAVPAEHQSEFANVFLPDGTTPFPSADVPHTRVLRDGGSVHDTEYVVTIPGRVPRTMLANANLVIGPDGTLFGSVCASRDVTTARRAEADLRESETRFRGVLETVRSLAVTLDIDGRITFANEALLALSGRSREEVLGQSWFDLFTANDGSHETSFRESVLAGEVAAHTENEITAWHGERRLVVWDTTVLYGSAGEILGTASIGRDITEQRALEARLADMSEHDDLTGLTNRRGFRRLAEQQLKIGRRTGRRGAILYVDLDDLKPINDELGHAAGDEAIRAAAEVLRTGIRESDLIARLGGDEFAIFAMDLTSPAEADVVASRLVNQLAEHNRAAAERGRQFTVSFTIGAALVEKDDDLDMALERADRVLNARKQARGRSRGRLAS